MIFQHQELKPYNTFGISAKARYFSTFRSVEELSELLKNYPQEKLLILGGGSNILFTQDFEGLVLKNEIDGFEVIKEEGEDVYVKAGAGENWHQFVLKCIAQNLSGVENLSLIPGSVGASPMQNIGAYGVEIKDVFQELSAYHISTGEIHFFDNSACEFGYRESVFKRKFKDQYVILNVTYKLSKTPKNNTSYGAIESELKNKGIENPTIKDISDAVIAIRSSKLPDPKHIGNAGSFFKNPVIDQTALHRLQSLYPEIPNYPANNGKVKIAAGWLIEKAGWKGITIDHYGVHKDQALVLVNYGGAKGKEIFDLSGKIIASIEQKFDITLEREVNIV